MLLFSVISATPWAITPTVPLMGWNYYGVWDKAPIKNILYCFPQGKILFNYFIYTCLYLSVPRYFYNCKYALLFSTMCHHIQIITSKKMSHAIWKPYLQSFPLQYWIGNNSSCTFFFFLSSQPISAWIASSGTNLRIQRERQMTLFWLMLDSSCAAQYGLKNPIQLVLDSWFFILLYYQTSFAVTMFNVLLNANSN